MPTLKEIRSDILLVGQNLKLSNDTRLEPRHIDFLIHKHRARGIREEYDRNKLIDPTWISDYGNTDVTVVNSSDDPSVPLTSRCVSRVTLPDVVSIASDRGVHRITHTSRQVDFYQTTEENYYALVSGQVELKYDWWWRMGDVYYFNTKEKQVRPFLILGNPMEGFVLQTEWVASGDLTVGQSYTVYGTQVVHNSTAYNPGQSFTAVNANYTSTGTQVVKFTNMKRAIMENDPYPIGRTLLEYVMMKIFTVEFNIAKQQAGDVIADAQDKTLALQNEDVVRRSREEKIG